MSPPAMLRFHRARQLGTMWPAMAPAIPRLGEGVAEARIDPPFETARAIVVNAWLTLGAQACAHNYCHGGGP
jgi:hypothetical protein